MLANHEKYVDYHHRVLAEVIKHVPINKVWSIDELSSRLPPRQRNRAEATAAAERIKEGLRRHVGECITCSIGLAPNGFLAKVASDMKKPDGIVALEPQDLPGPLFKLKLTDLPGINVNMELRLAKAGITSVEKLWNIAPKHARQVWGSVAGEKFWYNLRGFDVPDAETNASMIGHSRVLDPALRPPRAAWTVARRLTIKAATRLRRKEFYATVFRLGARAPDGRRWAGEAKLSPSQDNFTFLRALDGLWSAMLEEMKPPLLKKVSVTMHGLCRGNEITPDLFDSSSPAWRKAARRDESLSLAMDNLNEKYGAETIRLGVSPRTSAGFIGTKIAFSRIPDREEFRE